MKIVLVRRGNFHQDAENYMKIVFAHISHKILIRSVTVEGDKNRKSNPFGHSQKADDFISSIGSDKKERIIVECQPQGGNEENANLVAIVKDAISLDGNLELEDIKTNNSFTGTRFQPLGDVDLGPQRYYQPAQPIPIFFQRPIQIVKNPGIHRVGPNAYKVDENFASLVARDQQYLNTLMTTAVVEVFLIYERINEQTLMYTKNFQTTTLPHSNPESRSIYQLFAEAVNSNANLRNKLTQDNVDYIVFELVNGELIAEVAFIEKFSTKLGLTKNVVNEKNKDEPAKQEEARSTPRP